MNVYGFEKQVELTIEFANWFLSSLYESCVFPMEEISIEW